MEKEKLEYGKRRIIANIVEVLVCEVNYSEDNLTTIIYDFYDYLLEQNLEKYWTCFEAMPMFTNSVGLYALPGAKFIFTRTVKGNGATDSEAMGGGTQWVSDVVNLMKDFLVHRREICEGRLEDVYDKNTRLVFRIDGEQFEWK